MPHVSFARSTLAAALALALAGTAPASAQQDSAAEAEPERAAAVARADSARAALVQPPGEKGLSVAHLIRAPFHVFGAAVALGTAAAFIAYDLAEDAGVIDAVQAVDRDLQSVDVRVRPDFIGSRSWPALVARWDGLEPVFVEGGVSLRGYTLARAGVALGDSARGVELAAGHHAMNQLHFWGVGMDSRPDDRSDYALTRRDVEARAWTPVVPHVSLGIAAGWEESDVDRGQDDRRPDLQDVFAPALPLGVRADSRYARGEAAVDVDFTTVGGAYQMLGARLLLGWGLYRDLEPTDAHFQRASADLRTYLPVTARHAVALRGMAVEHFAESGAGVPFFYLPALGDDDGLRGHRSWRFRDRALLAAMAEWRYQVWYHPGDPRYRLDGFAFVDHGSVAPSLGALDWNEFETTPGLGLRFMDRGVGLLEGFVAFGGEGTRFGIELGTSF